MQRQYLNLFIAVTVSVLMLLCLPSPLDAKPRHELVGIVVNGNNDGIPQLLVRLFPIDSAGEAIQKTTDAKGIFTFDGLPPGDYRLDVIVGQKLLHRSVVKLPAPTIVVVRVSD